MRKPAQLLHLLWSQINYTSGSGAYYHFNVSRCARCANRSRVIEKMANINTRIPRQKQIDTDDVILCFFLTTVLLSHGEGMDNLKGQFSVINE